MTTLGEADAYQAWALREGNTAAALADQQAPGAAARPFASTSSPVAVVDGAGGILIVGAQVEHGRGWRLRALDARTRALRWEAIDGAHFQTCPSWRTLVGRGGRVYLAHEGRLVAIEALSGVVAWEASLPDRIETRCERAPRAGDTTEIYDAGPSVMVQTEDDVLHAFDRATGRLRWRRTCDRTVRADGELIVIEDGDGSVTFVRAADGAEIATFAAGDHGDPALVPGGVVMTAENQGEREEDGVVFVEPGGARRWFAAIEGVNLSPGVVAAGAELYAVVGSNTGDALVALSRDGGLPKRGFFARLFGGGAPVRRPQPWPKHLVEAMWTCGDALVVDAHSFEGEKRIAIFDARTLALRHDSGVIPDGVAPGTRIGADLVVYSFGTTNGPKDVRAVDPATGALRWERRFDDLDEILFRAGHLVLATTGGPIEIVDPATGATLTRW
jgi:outer membrane protein assembly factor BamB